MKTVAVIYWSGTGNTQKMAEEIGLGAAAAGAAVNVIPVAKASREDALRADAVALGCPAMGDEVLEENEMEPFVKALEGEDLSALPLVLFGSYGWGEGQWMRDWTKRMKATGAMMAAEGLIVQDVPDKAALARCRKLGALLASMIT